QQVPPMSVAPGKIGLGGLGRDVDNAAPLIQGLAAPRHDAGRGLVRILRPRFVSRFAGARNQVKNPALRSRPHIQCAYCAYSPDTSQDQRIFVNQTRGVQSRPKAYRTVFSKLPDNGTSLRVQRKKKSADSGKQSPLRTRVALPIHDASLSRRSFARSLIRRVPFPELTPSGRVQGYHLSR